MALSHLSPYELLITDVDGVLNDGKFYYSQEGKIFKKFGPHDSDGIKFFRQFGINVIAVTADKRGFDITKRRTDDLNVKLFYVPEADRVDGVLKAANGLPFAFIGDGYHDLKVFPYSTISYTTQNALKIVKEKANVVLNAIGGDGALMLAFEHYLSAFNSEKYSLYLNGKL